MIVAVTQRVEVVEHYQERRDCLDQRWFGLFLRCGITPVLLPNSPKLVKQIISMTTLDGFLLTGGGDLVAYGGASPERDEVEKLCIDTAKTKGVPLLGVCRGMQAIQHYFGVALMKVQNHVGCYHEINLNGQVHKVNSFHNWGAYSTDHKLKIDGIAGDGVIEAISYSDSPMYGIMWHPERESKLSDLDKMLFTKVYGVHR